jgi:hypothetical protein
LAGDNAAKGPQENQNVKPDTETHSWYYLSQRREAAEKMFTCSASERSFLQEILPNERSRGVAIWGQRW